MKQSTYNFISRYCSYFGRKDSPKMKMWEIFYSNDDPNLDEINKAFKIIQEKDIDVFENILAWDEAGILLDYLQIIKRYNDRKKVLKLSVAEISRQSGIPTSTIKRVEGLHCTPKLDTLCKILQVVDLKVGTY